jgi:hypothetical protein
MKIAIIGGGLFGITSFLILRSSGYDCFLLEKNRKIMLGTSTNNLNRLHWGYHYPRDNETARQSTHGYNSFSKFYKSSVIKYFKNYYLIAKYKSHTNFKKYLKFCRKNKLPYNIIDKKNFFTKIGNNIEGIIKVNEPIYSWKKITKLIDKKISTDSKYIFTNTEVLTIKKEKTFIIKTNKAIFFADIIVDASYMSLNYNFLKKEKIKKIFKNIVYQICIIPEIYIKKINRLGLAIMDGPFFSILPRGNDRLHLFYHVKHSIIRQSKKVNIKFNNLKKKKYFSQFKKIKYFMMKDINHFLPEIKIKFTNKFLISKRVLLRNKTDKRVSFVTELQKNFFLINSAKVDHSVYIASKIKKIVSSRL